MPPNLGGFFMVRSYYPSEFHAGYFDFERITFENDDQEDGVVGDQAVAGMGGSRLPEQLAVEVARRQGRDVREGDALPAGDVLGDEHVQLAVAVQIAEARVASGSVLGGL